MPADSTAAIVGHLIPPNASTSRERLALGGIRCWPGCWTMPWLRHIPAEKRVRGLSPEEVLGGLSEEQVTGLRELLERRGGS